ncbi:sugar ABC transporter substrate-binding protein [Lacisediminihabitans profunda]|uniref:Sugar ABC transporter substrate-binding protein n=1 Tax=Lacisediminihabitans profunda TaxID=2594790 RepID=A0A5C8UXY7_9MICO|nr:sugar ABC transporter substrate-binding protein [Lacisediminihabitans profunda]
MAAAAALALVATAMTGCAAAGNSGGDKVVTLKFWSWAPGSAEEVAAFNKTHPNIKVVHTDAGGGDQSAAKLLTAVRAGNAPDVAAIENTSLPRLIVAGVPMDITQYVSDVKDKFAPGTWAGTTFDGHTYGVPQDVGPMALLYRYDIFKQYGIDTPPVTWQEYKDDAAKIKAQNPKLVMANITTDGWGWYASVAAQAGDQWWTVKNNVWTVNINGAGSRKMMDFFQGMYNEGLIGTDPILSPTYNQQLNDGTMLSWPSAVWAPGVIFGVAPSTAGKWQLSPLPRWSADNPKVSFQGGSSVAVIKGSKHPKEAAEFAKWQNATEAGAKLILNVANGYPAALSGQKIATEQKPPALMPQQTDYYQVAADIAKDTSAVIWGPNTDVAQSAFTDAMNSAVQNKTSWADALAITQKAVFDDLKKKGFKVKQG